MRLLLLHLIILLSYLMPAQPFYDNCFSNFEVGITREVKDLNDSPAEARASILSLLENNYKAYIPHLYFQLGRFYSKALAPYPGQRFAAFYVLKAPGMEENLQYCAWLSFDSTGRLMNTVRLPAKKWQSKPVISEEKAIEACRGQWKSEEDAIDASFEFDEKHKCFVWKLERVIGSTRKPSLWISQVIIVNAHNGKIIGRYKNSGSIC